jgi:hypothetical protein
VGEEYQRALVAGIVGSDLPLPNGLVGRQRTVRISLDVIDHIAQRHADEIIYCMHYTAEVLANPQFLGHHQRTDPRRVEFVRVVGERRQLVSVAVKFLDEHNEAWVSTTHFSNERYLTRRLRDGTMEKVDRGP